MNCELLNHKRSMGLADREMTVEETLNYLKTSVKKFEDSCLYTLDEIDEYDNIVKQLTGEIPLATYYVGSLREHAHQIAEQVVLLDNFNYIKQLSDQDLLERVAVEYLGIDFEPEQLDRFVTPREKNYLMEGIKKAKDFLDFDSIDTIIEKYNWANVTGDKLYSIVYKAQKKLLKKRTKYVEDLVTAGTRILMSEYSIYFHHTEDLKLRDYIDRAKKFRRESWDFDLD